MADNIKLKQNPNITSLEETADGKLKITWSAVSGAEKYIVYRRYDRNGDFEKVKVVAATQYIDAPERNKNIWYKIRATKQLLGSKKSNKDSPLKAAILSDLPSPEGFSAEAKKEKILLKWKKTEGAKEYIINRRNDFFSQVLPIGETEKLTFEDEKIVKGQVYHYSVQGIFESSAQGNISEEISSVCLGKTEILKTKVFLKNVVLSLRIVSGADGYIIERKAKGGEFEEIGRTSDNLQTEFTDKKTKHFKAYTYRIFALKNVKGKEFKGPESEQQSVKTK